MAPSTKPPKDTPPGQQTAIGTVVRDFPVRHQKLNRWVSVLAGLLFLLLGAYVIGAGITKTWTAITLHGRAALLQNLPILLIVSLVCFLAAIILLVSANQHWQDGITLHEKGLILTRGRKAEWWPWENIERFDMSIELVKFAASVVAENGEIVLENEAGQLTVINDHYEGLPELIQRLRQSLVPVLHRKATEKLQNGQALSFHLELQGTLSGLQVMERTYPWARVTLSVQKKGKIVLKETTNEAAIWEASLKQCRNLPLLQTLIANPPAKET